VKPALFAAALPIVFFGVASAATSPPDGARTYTVTRLGSGPGTGDRGTHVIKFKRAGDTLVVTHTVRVLVKILFITAYRFEADRTETWGGDRLTALKVHTNDNGTMLDVTASRDGDAVLVKGTAGVQHAPSDTSTPGPGWAVLSAGKHQLVDPDRGRILNVTVSAPVEVTITAGGKRYKCQRIQLSGDEESTQWFGADGVLVKEHLRAPDGSWVDTTLQ
jgi:hypothetical protein